MVLFFLDYGRLEIRDVRANRASGTRTIRSYGPSNFGGLSWASDLNAPRLGRFYAESLNISESLCHEDLNESHLVCVPLDYYTRSLREFVTISFAYT